MEQNLTDLAAKHGVAFQQGDDLLLAILHFADAARRIDAEATVAFLEDTAKAFRVGMPVPDGSAMARAAAAGALGAI